MAQKLKIYACSGVGDQQPTTGYWLDDTKTLSNTQAVNNLLSMINLELSELQALQLSEEELVQKYNEIDFLVVALRLAQRYYDSDERLAAAGNVLGYYASQDAFACSSLDDQERSNHLEKTYQIIIQDIDLQNIYTVNSAFSLWWAMNVVDLNKVGLTEAQQQAVESAAGVGAITGDLATYLNNSKSYFLYTFIPDSEINSWPKVIQQKRKKQLEIYNYCLPIYKQLGGTEEMMQRIIRSSIITTFKLTPEAVLRRIKEGKAAEPYGVNGVGEVITMAVATIVAAVISAVVAIITIILQCVAQVSVAKYAVPTDAEHGIPEDEDLKNFRATSNSNNLLIIGAAILGFLLFKNNKRKRRK